MRGTARISQLSQMLAHARNIIVAEPRHPRRAKLTDAYELVQPMNHSDVEPVTIRVDDAYSVSGLLLAPPRARACYVLAHGAGAGMAHPFMERVAAELGERGIATLRYQFPYTEQGGKRPDPPKLAQATVRAAVAAAG